MTYQQLLYLKYRIGITTGELMRRFPEDVGRVSEVALLDIPENILREIIEEEEMLQKLVQLKRQLAELA